MEVNIPLLVIGTKSDVASERRSLPIHQKRCNHFSFIHKVVDLEQKAHIRIRSLKGQCLKDLQIRALAT
jgi:hypothetical protein